MKNLEEWVTEAKASLDRIAEGFTKNIKHTYPDVRANELSQSYAKDGSLQFAVSRKHLTDREFDAIDKFANLYPAFLESIPNKDTIVYVFTK